MSIVTWTVIERECSRAYYPVIKLEYELMDIARRDGFDKKWLDPLPIYKDVKEWMCDELASVPPPAGGVMSPDFQRVTESIFAAWREYDVAYKAWAEEQRELKERRRIW